MSKYLVYASRDGDMGEECCCVYEGYMIIESESAEESIEKWWELVTTSKEFYFNKKSESLTKLDNGEYRVKGWYSFKVITIRLAEVSRTHSQALDRLNEVPKKHYVDSPFR